MLIFFVCAPSYLILERIGRFLDAIADTAYTSIQEHCAERTFLVAGCAGRDSVLRGCVGSSGCAGMGVTHAN